MANVFASVPRAAPKRVLASEDDLGFDDEVAASTTSRQQSRSPLPSPCNSNPAAAPGAYSFSGRDAFASVPAAKQAFQEGDSRSAAPPRPAPAATARNPFAAVPLPVAKSASRGTYDTEEDPPRSLFAAPRPAAAVAPRRPPAFGKPVPRRQPSDTVGEDGEYGHPTDGDVRSEDEEPNSDDEDFATDGSGDDGSSSDEEDAGPKVLDDAAAKAVVEGLRVASQSKPRPSLQLSTDEITQVVKHASHLLAKGHPCQDLLIRLVRSAGGDDAAPAANDAEIAQLLLAGATNAHKKRRRE